MDSSGNAVPRGNIRDLKRYKQLFAHSGLRGAFRVSSITPSDIEFIVDDCGRFLYGEFKPVGKGVPEGQRILLRNEVFKHRGDAVGFIAEHDTGPDEVINSAACNVREAIIWNASACRVEQRPPRYKMDVRKMCEEWTKQNAMAAIAQKQEAA